MHVNSPSRALYTLANYTQRRVYNWRYISARICSPSEIVVKGAETCAESRKRKIGKSPGETRLTQCGLRFSSSTRGIEYNNRCCASACILFRKIRALIQAEAAAVKSAPEIRGQRCNLVTRGSGNKWTIWPLGLRWRVCAATRVTRDIDWIRRFSYFCDSVDVFLSDSSDLFFSFSKEEMYGV